MNLSTTDLRELTDLAVRAATEAGQMIAQSRPVEVRHKDLAAGGGGGSLASQVVTEIDQRSEDIIVDILAPTLERFELGLLTEEQDDDGGRLTADYFWCIDPLDGTLPFIEGKPGYSVSIALVANDGTPQIGVIYDPVQACWFHAISGGGAFRNGQPWPAESQTDTGALTVFADRSFLTAGDHEATTGALEDIARQIGVATVDVHVSSGAVMNAVSVLAQPPACYFKAPKPAGGGSLWDFAATACLFAEVGAVATDIHGAPLDLNRSDATFMNHRGVLFATNEVLAEHIAAAVAARPNAGGA